YNFKGRATINTSISGNTIDGGVVVYSQGGYTTIGASAQISSNNLMKTNAANDGIVIIAKDATVADGGYKASFTSIAGQVKSNTAAGVYHNLIGTTGYNHFTITGTGDVSDNFIAGTMIRPIGIFTLDDGGKINNNQGQGHYTETSPGFLYSLTRDGYTKWMNNVIAGNASGTVYNINGQVNGNKGGGYGGVLDFAGGDSFTLGPTGQVNNNTYAGNYGAFYSANAGVNTYNIYGEICGNVGKGWSGNSLAYSWSSRGVIYDQYGQINVYPGAKLNDNHNGISGGVFELTLGSQLIMYGGEMKGNSAYDGSTMFTLLPTAVLTQDLDHVGGGAVHVSEQSSFIMKGGEISGNQAYYGGGVLVTGGSKTRFVFEGGTIKNNTQQALKTNNSGSGGKWTSDIGIVANGDTPILDPVNGHFVEIHPEAVLGSGYIGVQNNTSQATGTDTVVYGPTVVPTASGTNYKFNQVVIVPASRTETLYVEQMDQFAPGNEGLTALRDAITNTTTGYAQDLDTYEQARLTYSGNVWISTDLASGTQKVSTNYPDELSSANYNKYEYVFSFQALDAAGVPVAGTQPTVVRPSRNGTASLDVNIPIVAGAYGYGIVKYYYPKSEDLTLYIEHAPAAGGTFNEVTGGEDLPVTFKFDTSTSHVLWTTDAGVVWHDAGTAGRVTLSAIADGSCGYYLDYVQFTAGDGTVRYLTPSAIASEVAITYFDLAAETGGQKNVVHAQFARPQYAISTIYQKPDGSWPVSTETSYYSTTIVEISGGIPSWVETYPGLVTVRQGYHFDAGNADNLTGAAFLMPSASGYPTTLKTHYALNSYTVKYDLDGGNLGGVATVPDKTGVHWDNTGLTTVINPQRDGYTFAGWELSYIDYPVYTPDTTVAAGAQPVISSDSFGSLMLAQAVQESPGRANNEDGVAVTLTARWNITNYQIIYYLDGGTNAPGNPTGYNVSTGLPLLINNPTRTGYTFLGWTVDYSYSIFTDITTNTISYSVPAGTTGNITLTAHWLVNETPPTPTPDPDPDPEPTPEPEPEPEPEVTTPTAVTPAEPDTPDEIDTPDPAVPEDAIEETTIPVGSFSWGDHWSLLSLILSIIAVLISLLLFIGYFYGKRYHGGSLLKLLSIVVGIATLLAWIILDDTSLPVAWVNRWTPVIGILFLVHLALLLIYKLQKQHAEKKEDEVAVSARGKTRCNA
ncbi:MAG: InlB B-repeat-containing protein, partial [Clostridiales Family XIII bacterium]|nr:InlB B-repeat-containing protein [Clostridiales Family XIII bacterium]